VILRFKEPIAHGLLTASLVTEIGGQIGWLATGMSFAFKRPVYAGEQIACHWIIADIDERGYATAEVRILNTEGITVLEATTTGVLPGAEEREYLKQMIADGDPTNGTAGSAS
jgi:acyl dehydratase